MDYLDKYFDDLYHLKTNFQAISQAEGFSRSKVGTDFKATGLISPRKYYAMIDTGITELNEKLKQKYNGIVTRCNGNTNDEYLLMYKGMEYLPINEWVDLCNDNRKQLNELWGSYIAGGRKRKHTISVDRIDNKKGYLKDNIQFVSMGFNAWKRNLNPVVVVHKNVTRYFMTCEEASEHYDLRRQTIGDLLRGEYREVAGDYGVKSVTVEKVLRKSDKATLIDYYEEITNDILQKRKLAHINRTSPLQTTR